MDISERAEQIRAYLKQIAPDDDVTSLREETTGLEAAGGDLEVANAGLEAVELGKTPTAEQMNGLEAIILPKQRPVVDIINDRFNTPPAPWKELGTGVKKNFIEAAIPSVGRVEVPEHPSAPYGGTGFIVGDGIMMTNRHVAVLFASGVGAKNLAFQPGQTSALDFKREIIPSDSVMVQVDKVLMIHPFWDMALLRVSGLPADRPALKLSVATPDSLNGRDVAVIGYPAQDFRNDLDLQNRIFRGSYNVKRLQPGKVREVKEINSFGNAVRAVTHDSSTLGGNSGSAMIDLTTGEVIGLHFAGRYLKANFAVPSYELARDSRVVGAGLNFNGSVEPTSEWAAPWTAADSGIEQPGSRTEHQLASVQTTNSGSVVSENTVTFTIPLQVSVSMGTAQLSTCGDSVKSADSSSTIAETEAARFKIEPDPDYSNRPGYQAGFLGNNFEVPLPTLTDEQLANTAKNKLAATDKHLLPYHHFTLVMNKKRRLAYFTAVNIDGHHEKSISREDFSDKWFPDPRLDHDEQHFNELYVGNPLDRGHLVRRLDPVWGTTFAKAKLAHDDSFHWTNSSPQHEKFNRNKTTWGLVENFILKNANTANQKVTVFTGPVFSDDDPIFTTVNTQEKVPLPQAFWKIVVRVKDNKLLATAFLLDQGDLLAPITEAIPTPTQFQKSVRAIEKLTGFDFHNLRNHDPLDDGNTESPAERSIALNAMSDIVLG